MLWLLQHTLRLEGNFRPNFLEKICPEMSMLLQYLQSVVVQIFCDFPTLPKLGFSGRLERTNKSLSRAGLEGFGQNPVLTAVFTGKNVVGKTGLGHPKWEKLGKTQLNYLNNFIYQ